MTPWPPLQPLASVLSARSLQPHLIWRAPPLSGIINLEELEQEGRDLRSGWVDLKADGDRRPLGRVQVSISCMEALGVVRKELDDGYVDQPDELDDKVRRAAHTHATTRAGSRGLKME